MKWLGGGGCGGDGRDGENRADGFGSFFWSDAAYWRNIFFNLFAVYWFNQM
jgi:hypothetical protein